MKLPIPQRGQPLDVSFIYDLVSSINDLWDKVAVSVSSYASIWTPQGRTSVRVTDVKFVSGQVDLSKTDVTANSYQDFSYTFEVPFSTTPVVTATPVAKGTATDASKSCYIVLTEVTPTSVKGVVKFEIKGTAPMSINILAIGKPV